MPAPGPIWKLIRYTLPVVSNFVVVYVGRQIAQKGRRGKLAGDIPRFGIDQRQFDIGVTVYASRLSSSFAPAIYAVPEISPLSVLSTTVMGVTPPCIGREGERSPSE